MTTSPSLLPKAARLLGHLGEHGTATPTELAGALGEPRSSVYRLLRTLGDLGWVEESGTRGAWRIGPGLIRLAEGAARRVDLRQVARPHLERLHRATEQTVYLCVRRGLSAVCLDRIDGVRVSDLALQLGGSLPLHVGGCPIALLAFASPAVREEWRVAARSGLATWTEHTSSSPAEVEQRLSLIAAAGHAVSDQDVTVGIASVGAPVVDREGAVEASIAISGPREAVLGDVEGSIRLVRQAARDLSEALGAPRSAYQ